MLLYVAIKGGFSLLLQREKINKFNTSDRVWGHPAFVRESVRICKTENTTGQFTVNHQKHRSQNQRMQRMRKVKNVKILFKLHTFNFNTKCFITPEHKEELQLFEKLHPNTRICFWSCSYLSDSPDSLLSATDQRNQKESVSNDSD